MKKLLFIPFIFLTAMAFAQKPVKAFSVALELGMPAQSIFNVGLGGSGKAEVPVAGPVALTVTAGYTSFYYKSAFLGSSKMPAAAGFVPLKAGAKVYLSQGVYAEIEGGAILETNYRKQTLSGFALGPGFVVPLKAENRGIDVSLRYERWSNNLRQTGIRVAYRFGW